MTSDPPLSCCLAHFQMPPERCKEPFTLRAVYWGANSLCMSYFADFKQTCRAFLATSAIEPINGALRMTSAIARHTHIRREFLITGTSRKAAPSNTRLTTSHYNPNPYTPPRSAAQGHRRGSVSDIVAGVHIADRPEGIINDPRIMHTCDRHSGQLYPRLPEPQARKLVMY